MELTKKDVISMIGLIKVNYPYAYKDVSKEEMQMLQETWFRSFSKYPKEVVGLAFQKALETCKMPPTIADLIEHIQSLQEALEPTESELWSELLTALHLGARELYYTKYPIWENGQPIDHNVRFENIYNNLSPLLKNYCGDIAGFQRMTSLNDEQLTFEKGRFLKTLPTLKSRVKILSEINPNVLMLVGGNNTKLLKDKKEG